MIAAANCVDLQLTHLAVLAVPQEGTTSVAVGLGGVILGAAIRDCALVAEAGIVAPGAGRDYALTANLRVSDNLLLCSERGLSLAGMCLHYGELALTGNLLLLCSQAGITATGGALPGASVTIADNVLQVTRRRHRGRQQLACASPTTRSSARRRAAGRRPASPWRPAWTRRPIDHAYITGNRLSGLPGDGIAIRKSLGEAMIKSNIVEQVSAARADDDGRGERRLSHHREQPLHRSGARSQNDQQRYVGMQLLGVERADVVGNLFAGVARQAQVNRCALRSCVVASRELRIAANRMFGIGPPEFLGRTIAIAVDTTFRQLAVEGNSVARIAKAPRSRASPPGRRSSSDRGCSAPTPRRAPSPFLARWCWR